MDCSENINDLWEWQEEDVYSLHSASRNEFSHYLWDGIPQDDDSIAYMLGEQTPIKDCKEFGFQLPNDAGESSKTSEEFQGSSQAKRRRMLQYDANTTDSLQYDANTIDSTTISEQFTDFAKPKVVDKSTFPNRVVKGSFLSNMLHENRQNEAGYSVGKSCTLGHERLDMSSQEWIGESCSQPSMPFHCDEMMCFDGEIDISDYCNVPPDPEPDKTPKITTPSARIKFKGRRSTIETPTKLVTSVAYPFALIKPSSVQGDITLKDINQRIHLPPPKHKPPNYDPSLLYPTSAFSGKPVVSKTKIRTEGGRGSITIMRTKG